MSTLSSYAPSALTAAPASGTVVARPGEDGLATCSANPLGHTLSV